MFTCTDKDRAWAARPDSTGVSEIPSAPSAAGTGGKCKIAEIIQKRLYIIEKMIYPIVKERYF
jgi:hypothetical protein